MAILLLNLLRWAILRLILNVIYPMATIVEFRVGVPLYVRVCFVDVDVDVDVDFPRTKERCELFESVSTAVPCAPPENIGRPLPSNSPH